MADRKREKQNAADLCAEPGGDDGLVRALSAEALHEVRALDGLAWLRHDRCVREEVDVRAADPARRSAPMPPRAPSPPHAHTNTRARARVENAPAGHHNLRAAPRRLLGGRDVTCCDSCSSAKFIPTRKRRRR